MARADEDWERVAELVELEYSERSKVVVTVNRNLHDDSIHLDVRIYWKARDTETWHPSRRGLSLTIEEWETAIAVMQIWLDEYYDSIDLPHHTS